MSDQDIISPYSINILLSKQLIRIAKKLLTRWLSFDPTPNLRTNFIRNIWLIVRRNFIKILEMKGLIIIIIVNFINYCFWCVIINHTHARRSAIARKPEITDLSLSLLTWENLLNKFSHVRLACSLKQNHIPEMFLVFTVFWISQ